jgi:hypothetical protein
MAMQASKKSTKTQPQDAIVLLKADHRAVEELFEKYEAATSAAQKAKLAEQICLELSVHTTIEEELFYPICNGEVEEDMLDEAYVEHDGAKHLIAELMQGSPQDEFYDAKVKVLSEMIKHHVKEEEKRDGLFAQAKASDIDLMELGAQLSERKQELKKQYMEEGIPTPRTRASNGAKLKQGEPLGR